MRDVAAGKTAVDVRTKKRGRAIVEGGKGAAARTVGLLGGILSYAVSEGIISINPVRGVKRPADGRRSVRLSAEEYRALGKALELAEAAGEPWQVTAAIRLLALTGCRRGEIATLRWSDVDTTGACLRLSDSKTGMSVRPLGTAAISVLNTIKQRQGKSLYVFPGVVLKEKVDRPFTGLPNAWLRVLKLAKADDLPGLTLHGLRHAFASTAHDLGFTEITIAALLGHSVASVTGRYIHHVDSALVAAAGRVSAQINAAMRDDLETTVVDFEERRTA
jgi:integrase